MPYSINADSLGRFAINFVGEPAFVHGFRMAPERIEPELMAGNWLLLTFAIWNSIDRPVIGDAVRVAKQFGGQFQLGVRPFEVVDEFVGWLPLEKSPLCEITHNMSPEGKFTIAIADSDGTPFWHWLSDGSLIAQHCGLLNPKKLMSFVEGCLSGKSKGLF